MHATDPTVSPPSDGQQPTQHEIDHIVRLYESGEHAQMEEATRALLDLYPSSALGCSVLGMALQLQGKDALPALQKTVELAPGDAEAHLHLRELGQLDLAMGSVIRTLEIAPAFAEAISPPAWFARECIVAERLGFHPIRPLGDYLALHDQVDYSSGTTEIHALWMNAPTLVMVGKTLPFRMGATMLKHAALDQHIADSEEKLHRKGIMLATDISSLSTLRISMRTLMEKLSIHQIYRVAVALWQGMRTMWRRRCEGLAPTSIDGGDKPDMHVFSVYTP